LHLRVAPSKLEALQKALEPMGQSGETVKELYSHLGEKLEKLNVRRPALPRMQRQQHWGFPSLACPPRLYSEALWGLLSSAAPLGRRPCLGMQSELRVVLWQGPPLVYPSPLELILGGSLMHVALACLPLGPWQLGSSASVCAFIVESLLVPTFLPFRFSQP
jgi:hypothetical protein